MTCKDPPLKSVFCSILSWKHHETNDILNSQDIIRQTGVFMGWYHVENEDSLGNNSVRITIRVNAKLRGNMSIKDIVDSNWIVYKHRQLLAWYYRQVAWDKWWKQNTQFFEN